jgi:Bacterial low temperature requirement A protein (LtrA)
MAPSWAAQERVDLLGPVRERQVWTQVARLRPLPKPATALQFSPVIVHPEKIGRTGQGTNMPDNIAFQPGSGNAVLHEDAETTFEAPTTTTCGTACPTARTRTCSPHHLVEQVDARTGAETVILALAVFYAWYMVAWGANWLDPDPLPVRLALVGLMLASLLMSVAIDDAFADRAWLFVTGYLVLQVLAFGGAAMFLLAELLFQYATHGKALRSRALGAAALAILAVPAAQSTLIVGIALSSAVLIAVAIGDTVQGGAQEPSEPP